MYNGCVLGYTPDLLLCGVNAPTEGDAACIGAKVCGWLQLDDG